MEREEGIDLQELWARLRGDVAKAGRALISSKDSVAIFKDIVQIKFAKEDLAKTISIIEESQKKEGNSFFIEPWDKFNASSGSYLKKIQSDISKSRKIERVCRLTHSRGPQR